MSKTLNIGKYLIPELSDQVTASFLRSSERFLLWHSQVPINSFAAKATIQQRKSQTHDIYIVNKFITNKPLNIVQLKITGGRY